MASKTKTPPAPIDADPAPPERAPIPIPEMSRLRFIDAEGRLYALKCDYRALVPVAREERDGDAV